MEMTDQGPIRTRREGAVLEVTLDRPKANAIDLATSRIMGRTFRAFRDDDSLRVAILRAEGEKFFCPGWDLKAAAAGDAVDGDYGVGGFGGLQELPNLNKPVIAAVNGICCGGGLELALSCDLILASDNATFALPEIRSGTVADAASIKLPKRIPYHVAMDLLLTGRWFDADEALRWGLIKEICATAICWPGPGIWRGCWNPGHRWSMPRSRKWSGKPKTCGFRMRWPGSPNGCCRRWTGSIPARISWRGHGPLRKSGNRCGRGSSVRARDIY